MRNNKKYPERQARKFSIGVVLSLTVAMILFATEVFAQTYEMSLNQRRMGDTIGVEIWVKDISGGASAGNLGNMSICVQYNDQFLSPAGIYNVNGAGNPSAVADSIDFDMDIAQPYRIIESPYASSINDFTSLDAQAQVYESGTVKVFQMDVKTNGVDPSGYKPGSNGKGTFIGTVKFGIKNPANASTQLSDADLTGVSFYTAESVITTVAGDVVTGDVTFNNPNNFAIRGITVLNPNKPNQAVNRFPNPALQSLDPNQGYPVYFERSGLIDSLSTSTFNSANYASTNYGAPRVAYFIEYSLNDGAGWLPVGYVAETALNEVTMGANIGNYVSGDIDKIGTTNDPGSFYITDGAGDNALYTGDGSGSIGDGYGGVLRVIWKADENFPFRSEQARLRVSQVEADEINGATYSSSSISSRNAYTSSARRDMSDYSFVLGRLFFVQLDGTSEYFRTQRNFDNPTQLTVEAWINVNSIQDDLTAETGIVVMSSGETTTEEGAWMLYLAEGKYPAFRAREVDGRSGGYVAELQSGEELTVTSDASPISDAHGDNWRHIAATVANGVAKLYVDGVVVDQINNTDAIDIRMPTWSQPIWIGVNPNDGIEATDYLHAGIKEVKVWRNALTEEQIAQNIAGVFDAAGESVPFDEVAKDPRVALELYYTLQAARLDVASDFVLQDSRNPIDLYDTPGISAASTNNSIEYRPDRSHIRLVAPSGGEGVSNLESSTFEVKWAAYGLGKIEPISGANPYGDIQIMASRDGGLTFFDAIDNSAPVSFPLNSVEIEAGKATWEPYNNITVWGQDDDLQGIVDVEGNYSKSVILRISGTEDRNQFDIFDLSEPFTVAPFFAYENTADTYVEVADPDAQLNLNGGVNMFEAWISPYRFPDQNNGEEYFTILSKGAEDGSEMHYALRLLPTGQLQFAVGNTAGGATSVVTATSSAHADSVIIAPNANNFDSTWYHVAVYTDLNNGGTSNSVYFYIDGVVQRRDAISLQLGPNVTVDNLNRYPAYIGAEPGNDNSNFVGAIKEVRFWGGNPGGQAPSGNEPSDLTYFIQGASSIRANELTSFGGTDYSQNLVAAFIMNGGSFVNNGIAKSIAAYPSSKGITGVISGEGYQYASTFPFMKLVEPYYRESIRNSKTDVFVRWIGFDYNRNNADSTFRNGNNGYQADLEFSVLGSGGQVIRPLQPVASEAYSAAYVNAMSLPTSNNEFEFLGAADKSQFALNLDASVTDPDVNDDGIYNDQGPFPATSHNGLLRLTGRSSINGVVLSYDNNLGGDDWGFVPSLRTRSDLFTVTPPSNFTVRVLLEGYHTGSASGIQNNIGTTLDEKGVKISLYTDNGSQPGALVNNGTAESVDRYENSTTAFDPANFNAGSNNFANIPFVFTSLNDGRYFVVVDHINHLPVMSRFSAPFLFSGDETSTWAVESGWDFTNWNGASSALTEANATANPPLIGTNYTAYGMASNNPDDENYSVTGLVYNDGRDGNATNSMSAMVGGDVYADGRINAADRARVVLDNAGQSQRSDVTGDGQVNFADRVIVYRNSGKISSLDDLAKQGVIEVYSEDGGVPGGIIVPQDDQILAEAPELSRKFAQLESDFINNTGIKSHAGMPKGDRLQAGGLDYKVSATTAMIDVSGEKYIDVAVYIENVGGEFGLGNATFGVQFDAATLKFVDMLNLSGSAVLFDQDDNLGYLPVFTAPDLDERTKDPISTVRTIDVNYDIFSAEKKPGINVPYDKTYLGTLRFAVKSASDAYFFNWHRITGVTTTDGVNVTGEGTFEPIDPIMVSKSALVLFPNGGEALKANKSYTISWTKPTMNIPVHIDFSTDNGSTWSRITDTPVMASAQAYNWIAPRVNSTECIVSLVSANSGITIDKSDAPFAIISTPAEITRPSINDPIYRGGSSDFIRWESDNQADVRFEFSENGLDGWSVIAPTVNSDLGQTSWTIPVVNTKKAVVRMVDINTNEVVAVSSPFRILAGSLTLQSPTTGEVVKFGEKKSVRWIFDNVNMFDLQLSLDGGANWQPIEFGVKAADKAYPWMVANANSQNAVIRAIYDNDPKLEYSRTGKFTIQGGTSVDEAEVEGYVLADAVPNPFNATTNITFDLGNSEFVNVFVYNMNGQKVADLLTGKLMTAGTHTITLDGTDLPTGTYTIFLNAGKFNLTKEVVLVK